MVEIVTVFLSISPVDFWYSYIVWKQISKWRANMSSSVIFNQVTKKYKMYNKSSEKLLDILVPDKFGENFYALQNVSFTAEEGDVIGIIGVNGAGKSTLSNLITGVIPPTSGEIEIKGQSSLIAIASGLNNNLTGRENIELKCLMLGFSKKEISELMPEIIDFADIGKFIDQPVKSYSSGMKSRLGFAISVNIDPDILVIDEALSVGDQTFADKCLDKMNEFKAKGKTIFFISHSIGQVKKFCQKALWLEAGEVRAYGTIQEIIPQYEKFLKEFKAMSKEDQKNFKKIVLEKRSKLRAQEKQTEEQLEPVPRKSRTSREKKGTWRGIIKGSLIALVLLGIAFGGFAYFKDSNLFASTKKTVEPTVSSSETEMKETEPVETAVQQETLPDIRYVTVNSANIRSNPDLNSSAVGVTKLGQSYKTTEVEQDAAGTEWVNISNDDSSEAWVSGNVLASIDEVLIDEEIAEKIDELIGFSPTLNEAIPMIGLPKGEEEAFNYTEYTYLEDVVKGFTINVSDSSKSAVINEIGRPHLEHGNTLFYYGSKYDFIFTIASDGFIDTLTVKSR